MISQQLKLHQQWGCELGAPNPRGILAEAGWQAVGPTSYKTESVNQLMMDSSQWSAKCLLTLRLCDSKIQLLEIKLWSCQMAAR